MKPAGRTLAIKAAAAVRTTVDAVAASLRDQPNRCPHLGGGCRIFDSEERVERPLNLSSGGCYALWSREAAAAFGAAQVPAGVFHEVPRVEVLHAQAT